MAGSNLHATVLAVGDRGVLIRGASGAGKTTLALALLAAARGAGRFSVLVADDQVLVQACAGKLVCAAPPAIAGFIEVRGSSPHPIDAERHALADLVVTLVPEADAPRFSEPQSCEIADCVLTHLTLAGRDTQASLPAILAWLELPPFVP